MKNERDWIIKMLSELVKRNSVNSASDGPGESEKATFIQTLVEEWNYTVKKYEVTDKKGVSRPSLVVDVPGENSDKIIWLIAHTDTVAPGDPSLWNGDPFVLRVDGDKVIGRGTNDNGIGIISALLLLKRFFEKKTRPKYHLKVAFVADEEAGSEFGLKWLIKNTDEFKKGQYAIVPDAGDLKGEMIEIAEKGIAWLKITVHGKQVHGSQPQLGKNAHLLGMKFNQQLYEALHKKYTAKNSLFSPDVSTFEPTKKELNTDSINIIPGTDVVYWDCRILPDYSVTDVVNFVKSLAEEFSKENDTKVSVDVVMSEEASHVPENSWIVQKTYQAAKNVLQIEPKLMGIGGGTFAGILRKIGIDSVVWSIQNESAAHKPEEFEYIENYLKTTDVLEQIVIT